MCQSELTNKVFMFAEKKGDLIESIVEISGIQQTLKQSTPFRDIPKEMVPTYQFF